MSPLIDPTKTKKIPKDTCTLPLTGLVNSLSMVGQQEPPIEEKISDFMQQLRSRDPEDIRANAELLTEIIKSFSLSFNVDVKHIMDQLASQRGMLNMAKVRSRLFTTMRD